MMMSRLSLTTAAVLGAVTTAPGATWSFDLTSTGGDVFWTSPTAVSPSALLYLASHQITLVEVDVTFLGIPFNNINVTNQFPPELLSGTGSIAGPAPITIIDQPVQYPDPP